MIWIGFFQLHKIETILEKVVLLAELLAYHYRL